MLVYSFTYVLLMKLGGSTNTEYMQKMEGVGGQALVHGGRGPCPPLENEKKEAIRGNFNLFHLCFTNEIKGGIDTLYMQNGRGWADRRLSMVGGGGGLPPPPLKMKKGKTNIGQLVRGGGDKYICAMRGQNEYPADI